MSDSGQYSAAGKDTLQGIVGFRELSRDVLDRARLNRHARFEGHCLTRIELDCGESLPCTLAGAIG